MGKIQFTKMEGAGNDYVYVNLFETPLSKPEELAKEICHRRYGIGSDGLILIAPSDIADVQMIMYNPDGSQSEMCGNGIRCLGKYAYDHGLVSDQKIIVETGGGLKELDLFLNDQQKVAIVSVSMGVPELRAEKIPSTLTGEEVVNRKFDFDGLILKGTLVSMGNPHFVTYVNDIQSIPIKTWGSTIEHSKYFPNRVNIEFVQRISRTELIQRTWERGAGETWACGTGASAVGVTGVLTGETNHQILIHLTGGNLNISWPGKGSPVIMTGPAREVFSGVWERS